MNLYNQQFYESRHKNTVYSATTILQIVQEIIPKIDSAVDIGCGVGTWLYVLEEMGAKKIQGMDGAWVNQDFLKIPKESFTQYDFNKEVRLDRNFDLAISLEVAEHIEPENAKTFVLSLVNLSDFILFSAAIPYQSGVGHVNEQWLPYWISLFKEQGFVGVDIIRKRIWNDESIPFWYRQNILLFVKEERISELSISNLSDTIPGELYLLAFNKAIYPTIKQSLQYLLDAIKRRIK